MTLKPETSDADRPKQYRPLIKNRYRTRRPRQNATSESQDEGAAGEGARPKRRRNLHRRNNRPAKKDGSGEPAQNGVDEVSIFIKSLLKSNLGVKSGGEVGSGSAYHAGEPCKRTKLSF